MTRLIIELVLIACTGVFFGIWQENWAAGAFMFLFANIVMGDKK